MVNVIPTIMTALGQDYRGKAKTTHASALAVTTLLEKRHTSKSQMVPLWPLKVPIRSPFSDLHMEGT